MNQNLIVASVLASAIAFPAAAQPLEPNTEQLVSDARSLVKTFAGSLKKELKAAIQNGGLTNGIGVCNTVAPHIAEANSNDNWTISRTSLKPRNPDNAPTDWQEMQLLAMEKQPVKDGKPVEFWQVSDASGQSQFRYMSAIPTQKLCLGCHGKSIDDGVKAKLAELYPEDKATGFSEGDLRGAFVVTYQP
ncbi:MAG: DUF3365 domain-containing protein [Gammaproteobacteria bacterium]|nr:MAG: DUF3365 domain-containing protein [Gammaproteobacteria bacterium]TNE94570.1 MAG: DUF3365 domain-containing protein [Gammaproteobacteria bacterium]